MGVEIDEVYMRRALQLAAYGEGYVSPNPMVGAVIVHDGQIIGEGFHRRFGEGHAEVNAVASVEDKDLLRDSTMYVTLEPCSHYGKTPPCAKLLTECGIPRVVVAMKDPFSEVSGRGIRMLRESGCDVVCGVLEDEAHELNRRFITAHTLHRPYIMLKWACSSDGFMAGNDNVPVRFSNILSIKLMHRERAHCDAIMVGTNTVIADNPTLNVREWHGRIPRPVTMDFHGRIPQSCRLLSNTETIVFRGNESLEQILSELYSGYGITSLMVEGGRQLLQSFIDGGLWDEARIEISPAVLGSGVSAPIIRGEMIWTEKIRGNTIMHQRPLKRR